MSQQTTGIKRYRAKVASSGFRGQTWQKDDIVEVGADEAAIIPHHFELLGEADDGSQDPELLKQLETSAKLDALKDKRAKATYDQVRPAVAGGPATIVEKTPEQKTQEAIDRKAEEKEHDDRKEAETKLSPEQRRAKKEREAGHAFTDEMAMKQQMEVEGEHKKGHR